MRGGKDGGEVTVAQGKPSRSGGFSGSQDAVRGKVHGKSENLTLEKRCERQREGSREAVG